MLVIYIIRMSPLLKRIGSSIWIRIERVKRQLNYVNEVAAVAEIKQMQLTISML